jgi:5-methylcytosine-specific restriction endonuclease McrA
MLDAPTIRTPWGTWISLNDYYCTDHWLSTARNSRKVAGYRCEDCSKDNRVLHVHHLHYDTLWEEGLEDLRVLCEHCHEGADGARRRTKAVQTFMVKKHGDDWEDDFDWDDAEEAFDAWLEWKSTHG